MKAAWKEKGIKLMLFATACSKKAIEADSSMDQQQTAQTSQPEPEPLDTGSQPDTSSSALDDQQAAQAAQEAKTLFLDAHIFFEFDSAMLGTEAQDLLRHGATMDAAEPGVEIEAGETLHHQTGLRVSELPAEAHSQESLEGSASASPPGLARVESVWATIILAAMVLIPILEILSRKILGRALIPGAAGYLEHLTLWIAFVGGALAACYGRHLALSTVAFLKPGPLLFIAQLELDLVAARRPGGLDRQTLGIEVEDAGRLGRQVQDDGAVDPPVIEIDG